MSGQRDDRPVDRPDRPDAELTAHASPVSTASTAEPGDHDLLGLTESDQDTAGDMGVSSERVGPVGPGQVGTTGLRPVGPGTGVSGAAAPEQTRGGPEVQPADPSPPKAGYPRLDPRHKEHPYRQGRHDLG